MKRMIKKVLLLTAAGICLAAVVAGGVYCSAQCDSSICNEVHIVVKDSLKRQFVAANELELFLLRNSYYPLGESMGVVDCYKIEQCLLSHEMVREVESYKSPFGQVYISVKQRVPVLGVVSNDGCYYVDSDRRVMPVRGEMSGVPVFSGAVSERAARDEYFDFAKWLVGNDFWSARIHRIQVNTPRNIVLNQEGQTSKIILGGIDGYEAKLQKLRKLYTKGFDKIGYPECREYDLRFTNQVVCRK